MSVIDKTKLNALIGNLVIGVFADPDLQQAVFNEVYANLDIRPDYSEILTKTNTTPYTPTTSYSPATKQFTEDSIAAAIIAAIGTVFIQTGGTLPPTPSSGQMYFHTITEQFNVYVNSKWNPSPTVDDLNNKSVGSLLYAYQNLGGF